MTALHGAIALKEVHQIAMGIADDLYLNMLGVLQIFFQINFVIAKGLFGFTFGQIVGSNGFFCGFYHAHATTAAAVDGLDDNGIAKFFAKSKNLLQAAHGALAAGNHGDAGQLGLLAGVNLVAEHNEVL